MNQIMQGTITRSYGRAGGEKYISLSFPIKGFEKMSSVYSLMKRIYEKSFLRDFQSVLTSKVL